MNYTKIAFSFAVAAAVISMTPAFAYAIDVQDNGTTAGTISAPSTQDNGTTAGSQNTPATQDNGTTAGTVSTPATQDNGTTAGSVSTSDVSVSSGGGSVSSGGGSSSFSGGGSYGGSLPVLSNLSQCQYITAYMKAGDTTSAVQISNLQNFLKNVEGIDVNATGVYDEKTVEAVKIFQKKYTNEILLPWGISTPTGQVYFTTAKKINEIFCKTNFSLTPSQLSQISAYRTSLSNGVAPVSGDVGVVNTPTIAKSSSTSVSHSESTKVSNGTAADNTTQVAAAAKTSILGTIWKFIKNIFGR